MRYLENGCPSFVRAWRALYGVGQCVKLHMLEVHVPRDYRRRRCGYMLSEEPGEGMHAVLNRYKRTWCRVRDKCQQFKLAFEAHSTRNSAATFKILKAVEATIRRRGKYNTSKKAK